MANKFLRLLSLSAILLSGTLHAQWMTGYFESQNGVQSVSQIPWDKYTHIIHFSASTSGTGDVTMHWLNQTEIQQMIAARPAGKKVLVCIQDNGNDSNALTNSTSPANIGTFVRNIVAFVNNNGYDGVDIDWEINVNGTQYAALFQQLRAAMPNKVIASAMSNGSAMIAAAAAASSSVDQFNVMCYDMDSQGNGYSWYNDALLQNGNSSVMTCDWRINPLLNAGVPASKIGVGIPFYGRRLSGVTKPLVNGSFAQTTVLYKDMVKDTTRWQSQYQAYDSGYKSDYLSIPSLNEFVSYNGPKTIADTAAWIKSKGFGGAMTFSLYYEFNSAQTGDARFPLSTPLYAALGGGGSTPTQPTPPSISGGQPTGTLDSSTTQATMSVVTNENASCKYATTAGVAYASMPSMFATTGGTTSSTLLMGLAAGRSYTYYVRCADTSGNATTSDYTVAFSVGAASSPLPPTPTPTPTPAPTTLGVKATPASGSGTAQAFSFQISDPAGYSGVNQLDTFIGTQIGGANNCRVQWNGGTTLFLENDAASAWISGTVGSGSISNTQCKVDLTKSSISGTGYAETVNLAVTFGSAYVGTKNIYAFASGSTGLTGWLTLGAWTVSAVQPPTITSGSPTGTLATSTTQATMAVVTNMNAACKYGTAAGTAYASMPYMFATTGGTNSSVLLTGLGAGKSYTYYARCADSVGNASTTDYPISFSIASSAPTALGVAANPSSGSVTRATPQSFTFTIQDPGGYANVSQLDTFFGTIIGGSNNCRVQWNGGTTVYLQNNAANGWTSGTLGRNASLSNSQCSVNLTGSSVSGTGYAETLKLNMTFSSRYIGTKSIYAFAADKSGKTTGWLTLGSWQVK